MIQRLATHLMLRPEDVTPSHPDWEVIGVFNPGVTRFRDTTVMLVRVAERPRYQRPGWTALPRWERNTGYTIDWSKNEHLEARDPRVVSHLHTALVRLTFISHFRVVESRDGRTIDRIGPAILPETEMEEYGIEDARITPIGDCFYITYVAVSRHGPATALASTTDFMTLERHGIIFCPENKDVVLFPKQVNGEYLALHRPLGEMPFARPEIWIASSPDLRNWGKHQYFFAGASAWEGGRVGAGPPPLELEDGWLEIYHGNRLPQVVGDVGAYCAGAMLLAKDDPTRILKVGHEPILEPHTDFENEGFVNKVVFPTGIVPENDRLLIYYGASDKYCAMVEVAEQDLKQMLV